MTSYMPVAMTGCKRSSVQLHEGC